MKDPVEKYLEKNQETFDRWPLEFRDNTETEAVERVVVIPALAEFENLFDTLGDLTSSPAPLLATTLVIVAVNNRETPHSSPDEIADNLRTLARLRTGNSGQKLRLGIVDAASAGRELPPKEGVGLARKIGMDWALRILSEEGQVASGAIVGLDADTRLDPNYLPVLAEFFSAEERWGAVLEYAHPIPKTDREAEAILVYELFLRHYELGLAWAGSPYAFASFGSALGCTARAYASVGGMKRSRAGEDFYFLQQLAKTGSVDRATGTTVRPSSRSSTRVPFGTGRRVWETLTGNRTETKVYSPRSFEILKKWLALVEAGLESDPEVLLADARKIDPHLGTFVREAGFEETWPKLRRNAKDGEELLRQFHRWFDGFKTMRLFRELSRSAYPDVDSVEGIRSLEGMGYRIAAESGTADLKNLLDQTRALCRGLPTRRGVI